MSGDGPKPVENLGVATIDGPAVQSGEIVSSDSNQENPERERESKE